MQYYSNQNDGRFTLAIDCVTGEGMNQIEPMVKKALAEKLKRYADKGMQGGVDHHRWQQSGGLAGDLSRMLSL